MAFAKTPFLLALVVLAAGCLSPAAPGASSNPSASGATTAILHAVDGTPIADLGASAPVATGALFSTGLRGTEPTIAATSTGTLFTDAVAPAGAAGRNQPMVLRSTDKGQTWEDVSPTLPSGDKIPPTTGDPIVYVDPATDRVFWLNQLQTVCANLFLSDDEGATWLGNPVACGTPGVVDHVTIVAAKPRMLTTLGYESIVYMCANTIYQMGCATSLDGGLTFGPIRMVFPGVDPASEQGFCGGIHSLPRAGPDGKVYVAKNQCGVPTIAVTEDDGLSWTAHPIATPQPPYGTQVHVAIDDASNVYAIWTGSEDGLVWFTSSTDGAATWREPVRVAAPGVTAADLPVITAGGPGKVAFAYVATTIEGGYEGKTEGNPGLAGDVLGQPAAPDWANATWNAYVGILTDALADELAIQTVTANDPADPIARGLCGRTRCYGMNDFIDATIDGEGRVWVAFVDTCTAECRGYAKVVADATLGAVGTLLSGPALRGDAAELAPIAGPPAAGEPEGEAAGLAPRVDLSRRGGAKVS